MHTFKTSSGYVFKLYDSGDICRVNRRCFLPMGTLVQVLRFHSEFSRSLDVIDINTGKNCVVNCADLELVSESTTKETHQDERDGHSKGKGMVSSASSPREEDDGEGWI
jgi:hypothetical protein